MDLTERVLYHQIYPAKLGTVAGASFVSLALIWRGRYRPSLVVHVVSPVIASAIVARRTADLERLRETHAAYAVVLSLPAGWLAWRLGALRRSRGRPSSLLEGPAFSTTAGLRRWTGPSRPVRPVPCTHVACEKTNG